MASTNKTTNYDLSQYIGTDKPTYLGDYNSDMLKIDTQMKTNADNVATAISSAESAISTANSANTTAGQANTTAQNANTVAGQANTTAGNAQSTANSALSTATNADTKVGDLANLTTTDKTSVVNAINEVNADEVYSTSEVKTKKLWTNNKPIYRKVVVLTSPSSTGTWTDYTHNIANIDEFISCSANINLPNLGHQYFADFYQDNSYYFNFIPKLTMFSARVGYSQYTNKPMTIIVEYTKTTD